MKKELPPGGRLLPLSKPTNESVLRLVKDLKKIITPSEQGIVDRAIKRRTTSPSPSRT